MTANTAAVQLVECRTVCTSDIQPPREYMDNSIRPRPVQPQPTACGLDRHQRPVAQLNQSVQPGNLQLIGGLPGSDVRLTHTSTFSDRTRCRGRLARKMRPGLCTLSLRT